MATPMLGIAARIGAGILAATGAWLLHDRMQGHSHFWELEKDTFESNAKMAYMMGEHGVYSGNPALDEASHFLHTQSIYGPLGVFKLFHEIKTTVGGFFSDVVATPEFALSMFGLAGALGTRNLQRMGRYFANWKAGPVTKALKAGMGQVGKFAWWMTKGMGAQVGKLLVKYPVAGVFMAIGAALFAWRLHDVHSGDQQNEVFRHDLSTYSGGSYDAH